MDLISKHEMKVANPKWDEWFSKDGSLRFSYLVGIIFKFWLKKAKQTCKSDWEPLQTKSFHLVFKSKRDTCCNMNWNSYYSKKIGNDSQKAWFQRAAYAKLEGQWKTKTYLFIAFLDRSRRVCKISVRKCTQNPNILNKFCHFGHWG